MFLISCQAKFLIALDLDMSFYGGWRCVCVLMCVQGGKLRGPKRSVLVSRIHILDKCDPVIERFVLHINFLCNLLHAKVIHGKHTLWRRMNHTPVGFWRGLWAAALGLRHVVVGFSALKVIQYHLGWYATVVMSRHGTIEIVLGAMIVIWKEKIIKFISVFFVKLN